MEGGKMFIQTDVLPQPKDTILDLGCGTGELSAYIAELVGPEGYVVGVDPDSNRVRVAQETHRGVKNLSFVKGNSDNFEGMGSEKYDIIILNQVFHWIPNKEHAFRNIFSSLKAGGKIAIQYVDHLYSFMSIAYEEMTPPEIEQRLKNMRHYVAKLDVNFMCQKAGFDVLKSYHCNGKEIAFENIDGLLKWLWSTSHGAFDLHAVTQERIQRFISKVGNPPFDFSAENINTRLIAVKPTDIDNEGSEYITMQNIRSK